MLRLRAAEHTSTCLGRPKLNIGPTGVDRHRAPTAPCGRACRSLKQWGRRPMPTRCAAVSSSADVAVCFAFSLGFAVWGAATKTRRKAQKPSLPAREVVRRPPPRAGARRLALTSSALCTALARHASEGAPVALPWASGLQSPMKARTMEPCRGMVLPAPPDKHRLTTWKPTARAT